MAATKSLLTAALLAALSLPAAAQDLTVEESVVVDYRPAVARIEAADSATARSRLQGVVTRLSIDEGDVVNAGAVVAIVTDATIAPQLSGLASRIQALQAQIRQAEEDLTRNEALFEQGFFPKARLDEQRTNLDVLKRNLSSAESERNALSARQAEGRILAPADAKVTGVNVVEGSVVSPGEVIAT
ncbi:MAG TPA: hypothetical protein PK417_03060, partial [Hyphomonas sp.]|nr:hypothetical protein [Hyphomonas sp.]